MKMALKRLHTVLLHILQSRVETVSIRAAAHIHHQTRKLPSITGEPRVALYDEEIKILLKDFPSNEKVTLHGHFIQGREKKVIFASCGHYVTDQWGQVCVWERLSTGGTYTGLESMGILWSLQPAPGEPPFTRMAINFTDTPSVIHLHTYLGHLDLQDIYSESSPRPMSLADVQLERWFRAPNVTRVEVHAGNIRGALYLPQGDGPFQGVIDLFGSAGGIIEYRAALLASRGFAALSLPYFAYKDLPKDLGGATLDYFEEAVEWFSSHPKVFPHGIGVIAVSKGVEFALCMSWLCEQVKCVVSINGNQYFGLNDLYYKGELLLHGSRFDLGKLEFTDEGVIIGPAVAYEDNLIPAWKGNAKHLILASEDDFQVVVENHKLLIEACPSEKKCNFEIVRYPGAGHLLEPPYTALCRTAINRTFEMLMLFGGQRKEHAHAQKDSWQRILNHLRKNIPTHVD